VILSQKENEAAAYFSAQRLHFPAK